MMGSRIRIVATGVFAALLVPQVAMAYTPQTSAYGFVARTTVRYQECIAYVSATMTDKALDYGLKDCEKQQKYAFKDLDHIVKAHEKEASKNPDVESLDAFISALDTLEQAYHDCIQQELRGKLAKPMKYDRKILDKGRKYGAHHIHKSISGKKSQLDELTMSPVPGTTETCETDDGFHFPDIPWAT
jgi:hypothetical protein